VSSATVSFAKGRSAGVIGDSLSFESRTILETIGGQNSGMVDPCMVYVFNRWSESCPLFRRFFESSADDHSGIDQQFCPGSVLRKISDIVLSSVDRTQRITV
jgi:hypothetical protein